MIMSRKLLANHGEPNKKNSIVKAPAVNMDHDAQIKTAISDFTVVAFSSKRSGKKDVEAMAYVSLGVIYDNQRNYNMAIEQYENYRTLTEEVNDLVGLSCAYNCLGVDFMLLVCPPSDAGTIQGTFDKDEYFYECINKAILAHKNHLEIGPDPGAVFVANTNLGGGEIYHYVLIKS
jgi:hypothetical protein